MIVTTDINHSLSLPFIPEENKSCFISGIWWGILWGGSKQTLGGGGMGGTMLYLLPQTLLLAHFMTYRLPEGKQALRKEITFHRHNRPQKISLCYFKFD